MFAKVVGLTEVVVLISASLLTELRSGKPKAASAVALESACNQFSAVFNHDLAIPDPESSDSFFLSFFLDEQAGEFTEKIKDLDGVLSVYVKAGLELP